jgi:uncharacterized hydantoinase/oxoprolinase family protein
VRPDFPIVVTGLGRRFLAFEAAKAAGFKKIVDLGELLGVEAALASPCVGVALMVATRLLGRELSWRQF